MDKNVVHIYSEILLSHKKGEIWSSVDMWMHLESVIQSKVSHKEKNKYRFLTHILESRKVVWMNQFAEQEKKHVENGHVDTRRERGSGANWKVGTDIYTAP